MRSNSQFSQIILLKFSGFPYSINVSIGLLIEKPGLLNKNLDKFHKICFSNYRSDTLLSMLYKQQCVLYHDYQNLAAILCPYSISLICYFSLNCETSRIWSQIQMIPSLDVFFHPLHLNKNTFTTKEKSKFILKGLQLLI